MMKDILKILVNILRFKKKHFSKTQFDIDYLFNEPVTSNNAIHEFKNARELFNERRSNRLLKETNEIRKKLHKKEAVYNFLKEKQQEGSLTNDEKKTLKKINRYLKNFKKYLEKLEKYQHIT